MNDNIGVLDLYYNKKSLSLFLGFSVTEIFYYYSSKGCDHGCDVGSHDVHHTTNDHFRLSGPSVSSIQRVLALSHKLMTFDPKLLF